MKVLVTGSSGFIGKNMSLFLAGQGHIVLHFDSKNSYQDLIDDVSNCDFIVHLAGVNRENGEQVYEENVQFIKTLLDLVKKTGRIIPIIFSSSVQALYDNEYGRSKKRAEDILFDYQNKNNNPVYVYRLNNAFGKYCRPNYNSVIATFAYNVAHHLPLQINDREKEITYIYIDDICEEFTSIINKSIIPDSKSILYIHKQYKYKLGYIADKLNEFEDNRQKLIVPNFTCTFDKLLYATYISYLYENSFAVPLIKHEDDRGLFAEFIKNETFGQVSVNIIKPGITKGNHYHNSKSEKFLVISGKCLLSFRRLFDDKIIEYHLDSNELKIVDIPQGYTHCIKNIGDQDSIVIMWAGDIFDENKPDTFKEDVYVK